MAVSQQFFIRGDADTPYGQTVTRSSCTAALGQVGERLARRHYELLGGTVLERNYRTRAGELDLVVAHQRAVIFVEVKTRTVGGMHPFDSITYAKRARLRALAGLWLAEHSTRAQEVRVEAVGVVLTHAGELVSIERCEIVA